MLRWSPIADNTQAAIATAHSGAEQTIKAFGGSVDTVGGLGKAAFWAGKIDSLNVFIDDAEGDFPDSAITDGSHDFFGDRKSVV